MIERPLFEAQLIQLAPFDPARDAEIEARWSLNMEYLHGVETGPARPVAPARVRVSHARLEQEARERLERLYFGIRTRAEDRLVGFVELLHIDWRGRRAALRLGIGEPADRGQGYAREALQLMLHYAFNELMLDRLAATTASYNQRALQVLQRAGFSVEVCRREAFYRYGQRWDAIVLGLLREEWEQHGADAA